MERTTGEQRGWKGDSWAAKGKEKGEKRMERRQVSKEEEE